MALRRVFSISPFSNFRTTLAGTPTASEFGGTTAPSSTNAQAATMAPFPDEGPVFDGACVHGRLVADDDAVADPALQVRLDVKHGVVLDVRPRPDADAV